VPQPQESQPDIPQKASPEEEPFEIELVVPEKLYRDAGEVEPFGAESPILTGRLRAMLEHLGITTAPQYRIKEVPHSG
jgi:hypothetical protein